MLFWIVSAPHIVLVSMTSNIILSQFDITPMGDVPKCAIRHSREDITSVLDLTSDYVDQGRMNLF